MMRNLPIAAALAIIVAAGVVHGDWTDRWRRSHDLEETIARIPRVPLTFGDWVGRDQPLNEGQKEQFAKAELAAYIMRRYQNQRSGEAVDVLLVSGRVGPISTHTPDVCYTGGGFHLRSEPAPFLPRPDAGPGAAQFWVGDFQKSTAVAPTGLRIFWAFAAKGTAWGAPRSPRVTYAPYRALYKLYVIRAGTDLATEPLKDDPAIAFIDQFLPELKTVLFAAA
jgi:hypothetical protein